MSGKQVVQPSPRTTKVQSLFTKPTRWKLFCGRRRRGPPVTAMCTLLTPSMFNVMVAHEVDNRASLNVLIAVWSVAEGVPSAGWGGSNLCHRMPRSTASGPYRVGDVCVRKRVVFNRDMVFPLYRRDICYIVYW